mmetsp:Transcript_501/g.977  ORF Transcript_501/g.977 Transcript_501/m.977 type:complete len:328 (-) Transcript_501:394-1377(-)
MVWSEAARAGSGWVAPRMRADPLDKTFSSPATPTTRLPPPLSPWPLPLSSKDATLASLQSRIPKAEQSRRTSSSQGQKKRSKPKSLANIFTRSPSLAVLMTAETPSAAFKRSSRRCASRSNPWLARAYSALDCTPTAASAAPMLKSSSGQLTATKRTVVASAAFRSLSGRITEAGLRFTKMPSSTCERDRSASGTVRTGLKSVHADRCCARAFAKAFPSSWQRLEDDVDLSTRPTMSAERSLALLGEHLQASFVRARLDMAPRQASRQFKGTSSAQPRRQVSRRDSNALTSAPKSCASCSSRRLCSKVSGVASRPSSERPARARIPR